MNKGSKGIGDEMSGGSLLAGLDRGMDVLDRAYLIQKRCSLVGFDWSDAKGALEKVREEIQELEEAMERRDPDEVSSETGDLVLAVTNLSRLLELDVKEALHQALDRFQQRFSFIERELALQGRRPEQVDLDTLESLWQRSKKDPKKTD